MNKSEFLAKGTEKKEKKKKPCWLAHCIVGPWIGEALYLINKSLKPELDGSIFSSKMLSLPQQSY